MRFMIRDDARPENEYLSLHDDLGPVVLSECDACGKKGNNTITMSLDEAKAVMDSLAEMLKEQGKEVR